MRSCLDILSKLVLQRHFSQVVILGLVCLSLAVSAQHHIKKSKWPQENGLEGLHLSIYNSMSSNLYEEFNQAIKSWERDSPLPRSLNLNVTIDPVLEDCTPKLNSVRVCNDDFGETGWSGYEVSRSTSSGTVKTSIVQINTYYIQRANDMYKRYVLCHELGHALGLLHQDEDFHNSNLGSCMDYTIDCRDSTSPNVHDWQALLDTYGKLPSSFTTESPSLNPTLVPSKMSSLSPTISPTNKPTFNPTLIPSKMPTSHPTTSPSKKHSNMPSQSPSNNPSSIPTLNPSRNPTFHPTTSPSQKHSLFPSKSPSTIPSNNPTLDPTFRPSNKFSLDPTSSPSNKPTLDPTSSPSNNPTLDPTTSPSNKPTLDPTTSPSEKQTDVPTKNPSSLPTNRPTVIPSSYPSTKHDSPRDFSLDEIHWIGNLNPDNLSSFSVSSLNALAYCGCPEICNEIIMNTLSGPGSHSCRKRMIYNIENRTLTPQQACTKIGEKYIECKACNPLTCASDQNLKNPQTVIQKINHTNLQIKEKEMYVQQEKKTSIDHTKRHNAEISMSRYKTPSKYAHAKSQNEERWLQLLRSTPNCQNHPLHGQELYNLEKDIGYIHDEWGELVGLDCRNGELSFATLEGNQEIQRTEVHLLWVPNELNEFIER